MPIRGLSDRLDRALLNLEREEVRRVIVDGVGPTALSVADFADRVVGPALCRIGEGWEAGEVALSQVFMAGRIMEACLNENRLPIPTDSKVEVGIGVLGDHHTLGKALVSSVLRIGGYGVRDLGSGLTPEQIVEGAYEADVSVLLISVLMLNRALQVAEVMSLISDGGRGPMPVLVGGAPFLHDPTLWTHVGADACGRNAADALKLVAQATGGPKWG